MWPLLAASLWALSACHAYPRDPEHTTERVTDGVLRVGAIHDPPFVALHDGTRPSGPEVRMAYALAESLDARVLWVDGGSDDLLEDLEHFRLDLVIGGLSEQTPWQRRIALTLPYRARDAHGRLQHRVAAVPPGENRWQMRVESFQRSPAARAALRGETAEPDR